MKTNIILTLGVLMLALGFIGCTASISTNSNANAKPANTNSAANTTNTASNTTSNTAAASDKTAAQDFTLIDIKFHRSEKAPKWDMRIEDTKGNAIEWEDLNLLQIKKITLHYDGKKGTAETE